MGCKCFHFPKSFKVKKKEKQVNDFWEFSNDNENRINMYVISLRGELKFFLILLEIYLFNHFWFLFFWEEGGVWYFLSNLIVCLV